MSGRLIGIGVGPGDPELLTLKAVRALNEADWVAYVANDSGDSLARRIAEVHLDGQMELPMVMRMSDTRHSANLAYDKAAIRIKDLLEENKTVAVLCEGDPLFYGSFIYLMQRLNGCQLEIIPGITSVNAAAAALRAPLCAQLQTLVVVNGRNRDEEIVEALNCHQGVAILKVGRQLERIAKLIEQSGRLPQAVWIREASQAGQCIKPLAQTSADDAAYFSLILVTADAA